MKEIRIKIEKNTKKVFLPKDFFAVNGENLQSKLIFEFIDEFVDGQARIEYQPLYGNVMYKVLTKEDNTYTIPLKNTLTKESHIDLNLTISEHGVYKLTEDTEYKDKKEYYTKNNDIYVLLIKGTDYHVGDAIESEVYEYTDIPVFVSRMFYFDIDPAIHAEIEQPEEYPTWIEQANAKLNQIDEALVEVDNLDIDVSKEGNTATITITKKDGTSESVEVNDGKDGTDGKDGVDGKDATINGVNTLTIEAGTNIELEQEGSTLTINNTYDDSSITEDISDLKAEDINLQNQIDAITVSSDVVDIVSTYTDLQNYDTSKLTEDDVIKVLQDSTHNDALSYYRWHSSAWVYIGSEGPFYTKGETDNLLNTKQNTIDSSHKLSSDLVDDTSSTNKFVTSEEKETWNNKIDESDLTDYVKNTDYATNAKGGVVRPSLGFNVDNNGYTSANTYDYTEYGSKNYGTFISKGTLENVITGKELINQTTLDESQAEQDRESEYFRTIYNAMPQLSGTGTELKIDGTAETMLKLGLSGNTYQNSTTGKNIAKFNKLNDLDILNGSVDTTQTYSEGFNGRFYIDEITLPAGDYTFGFKTSTQPTSDQTLYINESVEIGTIHYTQSYTYCNFTLSEQTTISNFKVWVPQLAVSVLSEIMLLKGTYTSATEYEPYTNGASPNPDYPQDIEVVTGDNAIKLQNKNLLTMASTDSYSVTGTRTINISLSPGNYMFSWSSWSSSSTNSQSKIDMIYEDDTVNSLTIYKVYNSKSFTLTKPVKAMKIYSNTTDGNSRTITLTYTNFQLECGTQATSYMPHQEAIYPINLGNLELCKIGDYKDSFIYQNDKWYKHAEIGKVVLDGSNVIFTSRGDTDTTNVYRFNVQLLNSTQSDLTHNLAYCDKLKLTYAGGTFAANNVNTFTITNNGELFVLIEETKEYTLEQINNWLATHNTIVYYVLNTPINTEITDTTLINQLNVLKYLIAYKGATNISQTNDEQPFIIDYNTVYDLQRLVDRVALLEAS